MNKRILSRRQGFLGVAVAAVTMVAYALQNEYFRLQDSGNQRAADRLVSTIIVVILILGVLGVLIGGLIIGRIISRASVRMEEEFEASIAHLLPEEQMRARHRREMIRTAMITGGYIATHEMMKAWSRRQREDVIQTRERNARVNQLLEEGRRRQTSWDDPV